MRLLLIKRWPSWLKNSQGLRMHLSLRLCIAAFCTYSVVIAGKIEYGICPEGFTKVGDCACYVITEKEHERVKHFVFDNI